MRMPSEHLSSTETFDPPHPSSGRAGKLTRIALYLYVILIACPIRYWPMGRDVDSTWIFALNYASNYSAEAGNETIFTMGPLGYLIFPQNFGGNLAHGLLFQAGLWLILAAIFADIFFRAQFPLRNIALFTFCFALATPYFWFDYVGTENLMLAGALMLVVVFHRRGSWARYMAVLLLVGLLPMFKLSAAVIGLSALSGFLVERAIQRRWKALLEAAATLIVPTAVFAGVCFWVMPSFQSVLHYLRGSYEIIGGYSTAMSLAGPKLELVSAVEAVAVLAALLWIMAASSLSQARFYVLLLAVPLFISFKHGFVRQQNHDVNFFCFVALALALVLLTIKLERAVITRVLFLLILFFVIRQNNASPCSALKLVTLPSGEEAARMLWGALRFDKLKQDLDLSLKNFPEESRLESEIVQLVGDSAVASLSNNYTNMAASHMRLKLYPVVQRYAAYTPYLDRLNAAWIRDHGPKFLVFDGASIDDRDPWAETPAMWLEVYRWYDARFLGPRNLLLERRAEPRFTAFETIGRFRMAFTGELRLPVSSDAVFWTMKCNYSIKGQLQRLLFRVPAVSMSVHESSGLTRSARVIPPVLVSPVIGNDLPGNLAQFYAVFHPDAERAHSVDQIQLINSASASYSPTCEVELLRPIR